MSARKIIKASVVQACASAYNLDGTLDKLERLTRLAKERDNSQLAVFPEAFIGGYPKYSTFSCVIGERSPAGRDEYLAYYNAAIPLPSSASYSSSCFPALYRIERISQETDMFLVVGVIEKEGGSLYCTAIFVDPIKGFIAKHRKLVPTASERIVWAQGDGRTLPIVEAELHGGNSQESTDKLKLAAAICWENYMPLLRMYYYSKGVQIYVAPTVDARPSWQSTVQHIALEGRCFVLSACQYATEADFPANHPVADASNRNGENVMIGGGSVIVSPLGKVLAGPLLEEEDVLTAELDLDDVIRGKMDLDVVGHYARNDIFKLSVVLNDTRPQLL